jgi:biopolymer transport protein ExbD
MNRQGGMALLGVVALAVTSMGAVAVEEKKISRHDLPAAVERTVSEQSNGATIRGFSTEVENGKQLYEVELTLNGHSKDISMDADGKIVEVEEEVSMTSLPANIKESLSKSAGAGTITKVETLTKNGRLVAYEAVVKTGTKRTEIQVGPDGKKLTHPE